VREDSGQRRGRAFGYLTLDEVREAGRTAIFDAFGDHLVYHDGALHVLPHTPDLEKLPEVLSQPEVYQLKSSVGVEFGWRHLEDCDCSYCGVHRSPRAA